MGCSDTRSKRESKADARGDWVVDEDGGATTPPQIPPSAPDTSGDRDRCPRAQTFCASRDAGSESDVDAPSADTGPSSDLDATSELDTGSDGTSDGRSTDPDVSIRPPTVGQAYNGPRLEGTSSIRIHSKLGVGLFWQSALMRKPSGPQRYLPSRPVAHLARISTVGSRGRTLQWRLPDQPDPSRHFYRNVCRMIGETTCKKRDIDADEPVFALMKVGLLEPPSGRKPSRCTFGLIHSKRQCDYGSVVAPERHAMFVYAYQSFDTGDHQVFRDWGLPDQQLAEGYHVVVFASARGFSSPTVVSPTSYDFRFDDSSMFPVLFP
jgi:hypothetical protein